MVANNVVTVSFDPEFYRDVKNAIIKNGWDLVFAKLTEHRTPHIARVIMRKALKNGWGS